MEKAVMQELALSLSHMAACDAPLRAGGIGEAIGTFPSSGREDAGSGDLVLEASRAVCACFNLGRQ